MIKGTLYQVISIVKFDDGEEKIESHGFYNDMRQAELNRDIISERMYFSLDNEEYSVFVNEINL